MFLKVALLLALCYGGQAQRGSYAQRGWPDYYNAYTTAAPVVPAVTERLGQIGGGVGGGLGNRNVIGGGTGGGSVLGNGNGGGFGNVAGSGNGGGFGNVAGNGNRGGVGSGLTFRYFNNVPIQGPEAPCGGCLYRLTEVGFIRVN